MEPLLEKDHTVSLDNVYSCPALARLLKHKRNVCVGTLKVNKKVVGKAIKCKGKGKTIPVTGHGSPKGL
jgi:hypothetical protein